MTRIVIWSLVLSALALAAPVVAAEREIIHVAPTGDDAASGAGDAPVKTPERAQELVRRFFDDAPPPKLIQVRFAPGVYELDRTWKFTAADNPPAGTSVMYQAPLSPRVENRAIISGGQVLGKWEVEGKTWKLEIPAAKDGKWAFRDLYVNGQRRTRARTPNQDYFRVEKSGADRRTHFVFREGDLQPIANPTAAEIVFLHDWSISRIPIAGIDPASRTIRFTHPIGNAAPHYAIDHFEPNPRYFLEGAPEFLDAPGEWHLDTKTGTLSYLPLPDEEPEASVAVAPRLEQLLTLTGDADKQISINNTHFVGLVFAHTHWPLPVGGYAGSQASFHEDRSQDKTVPPRVMIPAAITCDLVGGVRFMHCRFEKLGGSGLYLRRECFNCAINECRFEDIGANGIMLGETFTRGPAQPQGEPRVSAHNTINRCLVTRCGQLDYGAVGIWVGIARDSKLSQNLISHLPYTGISVGWKWDNTPTGMARITVERNHIHDVLQKMSDGGGIYTLGRQPGTVLRLNHIHDIPVNLGRAESNGIFMDEGSSEILVEDNTIYNLAKSPIRFHRAERNTLRNNRLVHAPGVPAFRYNNSQAESMTFEDNTLIEEKVWLPPVDDPAVKAAPPFLDYFP